MRVLVALPIVAALVLSPAAFAEQKDSDTKVMAQVEKLVQQFIVGFQKQDANALSKLFTPDSVYVTGTGKVFRGQQEIEQGYAGVLKAMGEIKSFDTKADEVHALSGGGAWAIGHSTVEGSASTSKSHWAAVYAVDGNELRVTMLSIGTDVPPPSAPASGSTTK